MSKKLLIPIVVILLVSGGAAVYLSNSGIDRDEAGGESSPGYPRTVTDFYGAEVLLEDAPERVVAAEIEYLAYLGEDVLDRVVWSGKGQGTSPTNLGMIEAYGLEGVCTMTGKMITMAEQVIAKNPDLVLISDGQTTPDDRAHFRGILEAAGIDVYFYTSQSNLFSNSRECLEVNLMPIAEIFAKEERAQHLIDFIETETERLGAMLEDGCGSEQLNVYVAGGAGKSRPNFLGSSPATYHPMLYLDDHAHNIMYDITDKEYLTMEFETLYQYESGTDRIDVVFISIGCWDDFKQKWNSDAARFKALSPFEADEVYAVTDWFPRAYMCLGGAYLIAQRICPDALDGFDAEELVRSMMDEFYGSTEAGGIVYEHVSQYFRGMTGIDADLFGKVDLEAI